MIKMIKFSDQSERKQRVRIGSSLIKLLSRETKKKQKTKISEQTIMENKWKIKNNLKIKAMGNITPVLDN